MPTEPPPTSWEFPDSLHDIALEDGGEILIGPGESCPARATCIGRLLRPLREVWWAHVRLPGRRLGWVRDGHEHFAGTDACGVDEPPVDTTKGPSPDGA